MKEEINFYGHTIESERIAKKYDMNVDYSNDMLELKYSSGRKELNKVIIDLS